MNSVSKLLIVLVFDIFELEQAFGVIDRVSVY